MFIIVRAVPHGVRGSGVPVRSSADTDESFGEVINQHPETPSVPSICGGPSGGDLKSRPKENRPEYGVRRSEIRRSESERGERNRYGVWSYRSTEGAEIM